MRYILGVILIILALECNAFAGDNNIYIISKTDVEINRLTSVRIICIDGYKWIFTTYAGHNISTAQLFKEGHKGLNSSPHQPVKCNE